MEKYIQNITLINRFINGLLSQEEFQIITNRLETDRLFKTTYEEHIVFLEGLKRTTIKEDINVARKAYLKRKWLKYIGIFVGVVLVSILIYSLVKSPQDTIAVTPITKHNFEFVKDSNTVKESYEEQIDHVLKTDIEKEVSISNDASLIITNNQISDLTAFYELGKKPSQKITINSKKDTLVICKEGTKLYIKANTFVDAKTNQLSNGIIDLNITEYYKLSDMVLANLSTTSNDAQLETGGMLFVEAKKGNSKLKIKEDQVITIGFFKEHPKSNMALFLGARTNRSNLINWALENETDVLIDERTFEERPVIGFITDSVWGEIYDPTLYIKQIMLDSTLIVTPEFAKQFKAYEKSNLIRRRYKNTTDNYVILRRPLFEMKNTAFKTYATDSISRGGHVIRKIPNYKNPNGWSRTFTRNTPMEGGDKYNVFETSNLGWINCDRFVLSKKQKIKYTFKIKKANGADVKLVFKGISSILPSKNNGDAYDFGNIPIGEEVKLIAIKEKNGKYYFDIKEVKIETHPNINFDFKERTLEEIREELETLNADFK
jgi:hypothetical protein